jgi:dTDP-4-dehydrorhamnose reductase
MKRLLVIGATGLVGSKLVDLAPEFGYEPHCTQNARRGPHPNSYNLDITNRAATIDLVRKVDPEAVIHTAALHNVDYCESHKEEAVRVNVEGTRNLADAASEVNATLVYLSTDYVFDGRKSHYSESDQPNPLHHYAWTKLEGEKIVTKLSRFSIARPSVIYGWNTLEKTATPSSSGKTLNFAMFVLEKLQRGEKVKAVSDQFSTPTFADNLAEALLRMTERGMNSLLHTAGRSCLSRFDFAVLLARVFGFSPNMVEPVSTGELKQLAKRPPNSCLSVDLAEKRLNLHFMSAEEGLVRMKEQTSSLTDPRREEITSHL